jgi:hypothetical protein
MGWLWISGIRIQWVWLWINGFDLVVRNLQGRGQEGWLWTRLVMGLCLVFWKI